MSEAFTLGVEEEYQLINPKTRELCGRASKVLAIAQAQKDGDRVQPEMHRCQIEIATEVCHSLTEVGEELRRSRQTVIAAAQSQETAVVAAGTHPFSRWQDQLLTDKERYRRLAQNLRQTIRELIIFGCHVHVGLNGTEFRDRPELALEVMNRCRIWLTPLLALTANSPFWLGQDTGYDSYRTELWSRLPTAGPPPHFPTYEGYEQFVQGLIQAKVIQDPTTLYWDIRLSHNFPTLEFRIADVCMTLDEAVMLAGLVKALVKTCYHEALQDKPYPPVRTELLKAAHWNAARYGLSADLIHVVSPEALEAHRFIEQFLTYLQPALESEGDWDIVVPVVERILAAGNGATRQRQWFTAENNWRHVVDCLIENTATGVFLEKYAHC